MTNRFLRQMKPPPIARRGADFTWRNQWVDFTTAEPFDFTARPDLVFTSVLNNRSGKVLATFSSAAGADGTITGDADGWLTWHLPLAVVNTLPITKEFRNGTDPRFSIWRARGHIVFDLTCSDGATTWTFFDEQLVVAAPTH